jgi:hypothetical protein
MFIIMLVSFFMLWNLCAAIPEQTEQGAQTRPHRAHGSGFLPLAARVSACSE